MASILPVFILLVVVSIAGYIGYQLYLWSNELADRGKKKMEKKNISFSKDGGVKVGVRTTDERAADKTQNVLVNVWNHAELPNYKSRLGWNSSQADTRDGSSTGTSPGPGAARSPSGQLK